MLHNLMCRGQILIYYTWLETSVASIDTLLLRERVWVVHQCVSVITWTFVLLLWLSFDNTASTTCGANQGLADSIRKYLQTKIWLSRNFTKTPNAPKISDPSIQTKKYQDLMWKF